jgi:hypothetical protein
MTLREDIVRLLEKAHKWGDVNEANTKSLFIEPLLRALGWNVDDLDVVTREYRVYDNTAIDYALKVGEKPRLFIEAKPLNKSLDDKQFIAQTVNYANNEGVVWCVLTNGLQYRVYKSNEPADMERKLFMEIDLRKITDESQAEEIEQNLTLLSRDSIETGSLDERGEMVFTDGRVRAALINVLSNPPKAVIGALMQRLGAGAGLSRERVRESLRRMAVLLRGDVAPVAAVGPPPHPRSRVASDDVKATMAHQSQLGPQRWVPLDELSLGQHQRPPARLLLPDGTTRDLRAWKDLLHEVAAFLVVSGALTAQDCPIASGSKRYLLHTTPVHPTGRTFRAPARAGDLWVETNLSASSVVRQSLRLIGKAGLGHGPKAFKVWG